MRTESEELRTEVEQARQNAATEMDEAHAAYGDQMKDVQEKNQSLSAEIETLRTRYPFFSFLFFFILCENRWNPFFSRVSSSHGRVFFLI
jgi:hypothetical protein